MNQPARLLHGGHRPRQGTRRPVAAEPDPGPGRRTQRSPLVTRSQRAWPPRKDAISPIRSAIGSTRASVATRLAMAQLNQGELTCGRCTIPGGQRRGRGGSRSDLDGLAGWRARRFALAWHGDVGAARSAANASLVVASGLYGVFVGPVATPALGVAALAAGDGQTALEASDAAWQYLSETTGNALRCSGPITHRPHWPSGTWTLPVAGPTMPSP